MTLREALTRATRQLDASPDLRADAARDAALLLRHALGISHATLLAYPGRALAPGQQAAYDAMVMRRVANEPIQYITGEQEFYGLALRVTPDVLIPRPETELLVEAVLAELDGARPVRILDVGTGSGAIAIGLAHYLPSAQITAVDLSTAALEVAASNAARMRSPATSTSSSPIYWKRWQTTKLDTTSSYPTHPTSPLPITRAFIPRCATTNLPSRS
jgi:release factor glutamine methyltransferase